jgi:hypothetical protein
VAQQTCHPVTREEVETAQESLFVTPDGGVRLRLGIDHIDATSMAILERLHARVRASPLETGEPNTLYLTAEAHLGFVRQSLGHRPRLPKSKDDDDNDKKVPNSRRQKQQTDKLNDADVQELLRRLGPQRIEVYVTRRLKSPDSTIRRTTLAALRDML